MQCEICERPMEKHMRSQVNGVCKDCLEALVHGDEEELTEADFK